MIAPMKKIIVVSRGASREELLLALRELGVLHLEPTDPMAAAPDKLLAELALVRRSCQAIGSAEPSGRKPDLDAHAAAEEILSVVRRGEEGRNRLSVLAREAARAGLWGDLRIEQLQSLAEAGVPVKFYMVPAKLMGHVEAECVVALADLPGKQVLAAVVQREGEPSLPEEAEPVQPPQRDLPTIRTEAKELDAALAADSDRLADLASLGDELAAAERKLAGEAELAAARAGGFQGGDLYALQGWAPVEAAETLAGDLAAAGLGAAVQVRDPDTDEEPPTLIRYPRWASPIKGLFEILGTSPGYREFDVSGFFMIALPIFAAMLIGDAGYGLLFLVVPLLLYRKAVAKAGPAKIHLVITFGAVTLVWGVLTGNYFGVTAANLLSAGGIWAGPGRVLHAAQLIRGGLEQQGQVIMKVSFVFGTIHLSLAQLRQALRWMPSLRSLSNVGWTSFLWGMLLVIWYLFFGSRAEPAQPLHPAAGWLLLVGAIVAIVFAHPSRNPLKMLGLGLASFPLSAIGTFSDTISYIRLMVVGVASAIIAQTFNSLGAQCAAAATWFAGAPIVVIGHAMNIALCLIAILAHGVRLNMLEFSSNAGLEWSGYAYEPFAEVRVKESG